VTSLVSLLICEFSVGCDLSASTTAFAKNGRNESLTPSRAAKSFFTRLRSRAMRVTSTSTTVVSCAEVCSDATMRVAMVRRSRDIFSVVPRRGLGTAAVDAAAGAAAGADAAGAASAALAASAAARMSCLRMRPPTPVPLIDARSTLCCAASLRTSGVT